jgi:arylsulfatase
LNEFSRRALDKNLLVIITGDHGQSLGEHGLMASHGSNLHLEQIHVPLLIVWPGEIPANLRLSDIVGLQAVPGTISELASLDKNAFPGGSLAGCWSGRKCGDGSVLSELSLPQSPGHRPIWMKSLITSDRHFILERNGGVELYDWKSDPQEVRNLADAAAESSLVETLGTKLAEIIPEAAAAWAVHTGKAPVAAR